MRSGEARCLSSPSPSRGEARLPDRAGELRACAKLQLCLPFYGAGGRRAEPGPGGGARRCGEVGVRGAPAPVIVVPWWGHRRDLRSPLRNLRSPLRAKAVQEDCLPTPPEGFLDDLGAGCRCLLQEQPPKTRACPNHHGGDAQGQGALGTPSSAQTTSPAWIRGIFPFSIQQDGASEPSTAQEV